MTTGNVLTEGQRTAVGIWLRTTADLIGLRDITIVIDHGPPLEGSWATVWPSEMTPEAVIAVSPDLLTQSATDIERALVHELIHIHHRDLKNELIEASEGCSRMQQDWILSVVNRRVEYMVDSLARVLVDHIELPSVMGLRDTARA